MPFRKLGAFCRKSQSICTDSALVSDNSTALAFVDAPQHGAGLSRHAPSMLDQRPGDSHIYSFNDYRRQLCHKSSLSESFAMQVYTESRSQLIKAVLRTPQSPTPILSHCVVWWVNRSKSHETYLQNSCLTQMRRQRGDSPDLLTCGSVVICSSSCAVEETSTVVSCQECLLRSKH